MVEGTTGGRISSFIPRVLRLGSLGGKSMLGTKLRRKRNHSGEQTRRTSYAHSSVSAATVVNELGAIPEVLQKEANQAPTDFATSSLKAQRGRGKTSPYGGLEEFPPAPKDIEAEIVDGMRQVSWSLEHRGFTSTMDAGGLRMSAGDRTENMCSVKSNSLESSEMSQSSGSAFWSQHDRRISMAADGQKAREIIDAMVDDCRSAMPGWRLDEGRGTFNDVLGQRSAIHPIVLAFARAHIEAARVTLGPEHVWLAILQGVAALLRHGVAVDAQQPGAQSAAARQGYAGESSTADTGRSSLSDLWRALRDSSAVPGVLVAAHSGHHVRVFGDDVADRHTLHGSRGAAPLAMAAAAAGHIRQTGRSQVLLGRPSSNKQRVVQRQTNPAWMEALARGPGIQGMTLTGSLQSWAALCVLSQQLKETYTGQRSRGFDWWLHRQHLLCRDLADYYAAQEEFIQTGSVPKVWTEWLALALFDGHSGAPRGTRMDGWLGALFAVDCVGMPVHERERWWIEWEDVPSGIDLVRVKHGSGGWVNLYSGFVGIQQLVNDPVRSRAETGTLLGDDLEAAFGLYPTTNGQSAVNTARRKSAAAAAAAGGDGDGVGVRDCADTLTASREEPMMTQGSASPRASSVSERDLNRAYCMATGQPLPASPERPPPLQRAMAPLIGWALDR